MRLRFWNSSQSSTLVIIEGCLDTPKTSAPRRKTRVATYWFAPLIKLTTAITAATPITTPRSVRTLRSLCAHKLDVAIFTASEKFIDRFAVVVDTGRFAVVAEEDHFAVVADDAAVSGWSMNKAMRECPILPYAPKWVRVTVNSQGMPTVSLQIASAWPASRSASTDHRGL